MTGNARLLAEQYKKAALAASIQVSEKPDMLGAMLYALDLCERKDACTLLPSGCEAALAASGPAHCAPPGAKTLAAPGLDPEAYAALAELGASRGFAVLREGLRAHISGIDLSFGLAEFGIAETATCVLNSYSEEDRLASMLCEIHVLALPKTRLVKDALAAEGPLREMLASGPMYAAFISGPSRTADIERVLAIGVHGPLELHVVLLEE